MKRQKTRRVFDASAILAVFYNEPGKKQVRLLLDKSEPLISSVNLCEVFSKLLEDGLNSEQIWESFFALDIDVVDFNADFALGAARMRPLTKQFGLSLGDRACLALAIQHAAIAVTADKSWAKLDICKVEVIR
jgi:ribonuclease VapC